MMQPHSLEQLANVVSEPGVYRVESTTVGWEVYMLSDGKPRPMDRIWLGLAVSLKALVAVSLCWLWIPLWCIGWLAEKWGRNG